MAPTFLWILFLGMAFSHHSAFGADVGVNYGRLGNNLPTPTRVIQFLANDLNHKIPLVRLFDPDAQALAALASTNLVISLGVVNNDLPQMAANLDFARSWLQTYVLAYIKQGTGARFRYLTLGNEVIPGALAVNVLPAMKNLYQALLEQNLAQIIQVSTVVPSSVLTNTFPPSNSQFAPDVAAVMTDISKFLYSIGSPLLINVYPYFAYASDPTSISLDYALFKAQAPVVVDGDFKYFNLFDAMVDSFVVAMVKAVGKEDVKLVVSESGWPSAGNEHATIPNAQTYNNNLKNHINTKGGTPRRPDLNLETYIFALFNENQKPGGIEQNFGSFYPNLSPVYPLWG